MFCFVMLCYVLLCYVMLCFVLLCFVMFCYVLLCYVMFCFVLWCDVMWCDVMWCDVMWCDVLFCFVMRCYVMLPSMLKHLYSTRCRWASSRDCRSRSLVIRCDSQLWLFRPSASVFAFKAFFDLLVNVSMFLVVSFFCYFSSWSVNYQWNWYGGKLSSKIFHTLLRNGVLLDLKSSWKIEMRRD